jgi:hypothetical protein
MNALQRCFELEVVHIRSRARWCRREAISMKRLLIVGIVGGAHLLTQIASYVLALALGPDGGTPLYGFLQVLTFPMVWLAERLELPRLGSLYFVANSALWAGAVYLVLFAVGLPREPTAGGESSRSSIDRG